MIAVEERRASLRRQPQELPWLASARVRPGPEVRVINLSCDGALVETQTRLLPGARLTLQVLGPAVRLQVPSRVLRCHVSALDPKGGIRYRGAVRFEHRLDLIMPGGGTKTGVG